MQTHQTYYCQKKADGITSTANALEHTLARVIELSRLCDINLTKEAISQLKEGNPTIILALIKDQYDKMETEAALCELKKKIEPKHLAIKDENLSKLKEEVKYMTDKVLPTYVWDGYKISQNGLKKFLNEACTVNLTAQQKADIDLIDAVAKVLPRFNPTHFIDGNKACIEGYLELSHLFNN
ncbi:MAG: hypothetical protein ABFC90_07365 [Bacteroidales bacterium]